MFWLAPLFWPVPAGTWPVPLGDMVFGGVPGAEGLDMPLPDKPVPVLAPFVPLPVEVPPAPPLLLGLLLPVPMPLLPVPVPPLMPPVLPPPAAPPAPPAACAKAALPVPTTRQAANAKFRMCLYKMFLRGVLRRHES